MNVTSTALVPVVKKAKRVVKRLDPIIIVLPDAQRRVETREQAGYCRSVSREAWQEDENQWLLEHAAFIKRPVIFFEKDDAGVRLGDRPSPWLSVKIDGFFYELRDRIAEFFMNWGPKERPFKPERQWQFSKYGDPVARLRPPKE